MSEPKPDTPSTTHLSQTLGIARPVFGAPMAKIAGGRLAAAVSTAGGLGVIGGGYGDPVWLAEQVAMAGSARFGIGLITWNLADGAVESALSYQPTAIWLSFGDPTPHVDPIHAAGVPLICQVSSVDEARAAVAAGAAVVVAQGNESGGHGHANRALFGLIPAVVAAVDPVPVVAAGGISGPEGLVAAQALGASAVCLGTALYATEESLDVAEAKQRLVGATGDDTIRSVVYDRVRGPDWPEGFTGRSIRTPWTDRYAGSEGEMDADLDRLRADHERAVAERDMDVRVVWAGESVDGVTAIRPAAEVVEAFPPFFPA